MKAVALAFYLLLACVSAAGAAEKDTLFHVKHISIKGNKRTKDQVLLREWDYQLGDSFSNKLLPLVLDTFQKRLTGIGLFNYVSVQAYHDTLHIQVNERIYSWGTLRFGIADRNFFVWADLKDLSRVYYGARMNLNNISGLNKRLFFTFIYGYNKSVEITYSKPFNYHSNGWAWSVAGEYFWNREIWHKTSENQLLFLKVGTGNVQERWQVLGNLKRRINYFDRIELEGISRWISIEDTVISKAENPNYLLGGQTQSYFSLGTRWVSDHRIQRDYPVGGYLISAEVRPGLLRSPGKQSMPLFFSFRASKYHQIMPWLYSALFVGSQYFLGGDLPYQMTRQLGYRSDYVRGYEAYVADGRGFILSKMALRAPLLNNKIIHLGNRMPFPGARKIPISLWFNIFADMGRVIQPTTASINSLADDWMNGVGCGLDVTMIYSALARIEVSRSRIGETRFNISFLNAF